MFSLSDRNLQPRTEIHLVLLCCRPFLMIFFPPFIGINIFLDGYVPTENLRFRDASLVFKVAETANEEEVKKMCMYKYPGMKKKMGEFELSIVAGEFTDSEIMVMLGENGKCNSCWKLLLQP